MAGQQFTFDIGDEHLLSPKRQLIEAQLSATKRAIQLRFDLILLNIHRLGSDRMEWALRLLGHFSKWGSLSARQMAVLDAISAHLVH